MKKAIFLTLLLTALIILAGCGEKDSKSEMSIVCTAFPQYDFVRQITKGTGAELTMLIKPGSEAHSYEPTPNDRIKIDECNLFIGIGGGSEPWAETVLSSFEGSMNVINIADLVDLIDTNANGEHAHSEKDGHVWTLPENAVKIVRELCLELCDIFPENSDKYIENTEKYIAELEALSSDFKTLSDSAENKTVVFGDRNPFAYLARDMGLDIHSPFSGCSEQTEASAGEIADIIDLVKAQKIGVIYKISLSNEKLASSISNETGAKILTLHSCHTLSADDFKAGVTYIDLMRQNLEALTEGLS